MTEETVTITLSREKLKALRLAVETGLQEILPGPEYDAIEKILDELRALDT